MRCFSYVFFTSQSINVIVYALLLMSHSNKTWYTSYLNTCICIYILPGHTLNSKLLRLLYQTVISGDVFSLPTCYQHQTCYLPVSRLSTELACQWLFRVIAGHGSFLTQIYFVQFFFLFYIAWSKENVRLYGLEFFFINEHIFLRIFFSNVRLLICS